ncbi:hypothetical protein DRH29_02580 [candidate division Kazan bacterium]|uniref:PrgI family protein n=1 Tax=candidate division Kazan bacterium TaxID=2202143 RepID=A0A420ZCI7_UNCK3|nr:MAG: hypothetical protein DRH29_02580 [candidate division Kazan bacterium]
MGAKIPQNVTKEDKLVGPLTLKQFLYVLAGSFLIFVVYQFYAQENLAIQLYFAEFILIALLIAIATILMAFIQINGRPFEVFLLNVLKYFMVPRQRSWHKEPRKHVAAIKVRAKDIKDTKSEIKERKSGREFKTQIEKLASILDTGGTINPEDYDAITTQISSVEKPKTGKGVETPTDVEDILEDAD